MSKRKDQPGLFDVVLPPPPPINPPAPPADDGEPEGPIYKGPVVKWQIKAIRFHKTNPHVFARVVFYCRQAKAAGRTRTAIELLFNRMRWDYTIRTEIAEKDLFKLNQNYKAWYARHIMALNPSLVGIFETRNRKDRAALFGRGGADA